MTVKVAIAWTPKGDVSEIVPSDLTTLSDESASIEIPEHGQNDRIALWTANSLGALVSARLPRAFADGLSTYSAPAPLRVRNIPGQVRLTLRKRMAGLLSSEILSLGYTTDEEEE